MPETEDLRQKVDEFLRQALAQPDCAARTQLIGKATYWNQLALKKTGERPRYNPWEPRTRTS